MLVESTYSLIQDNILQVRQKVATLHKIFQVMKIIIWGYGKMGKAVEKAAKERGHIISGIVDVHNINEIDKSFLQKADIVIEFTTPEAAVNNYLKCFEAGIPVVSGTTGWYEHKKDVENACKKYQGTFFYASNFSLGVNIFFELNKFLAKLMNKIPQYSASISETHHIHKLDKPSGTAITIANQIIENHSSYNSWVTDEKTEPGILPIISHREGEIIGTHIVEYKSDIDKIEIKHEAFSREGFARGAVIAAEFVLGKKGCFGMEDLLNSL